MKLSIEHYLASNNPVAVNQLLQKNGIKNQVDMLGMIKGLQYVMQKKGNQIAGDLAAIDTPYKLLILSHVPEVREAVSNACGCSHFAGEDTSNCAGCGGKCGGSSNTTGDQNSVASTAKKEDTPMISAEMKSWLVPAILTGILIAVVAKG